MRLSGAVPGVGSALAVLLAGCTIQPIDPAGQVGELRTSEDRVDRPSERFPATAIGGLQSPDDLAHHDGADEQIA